MTKRTENGMIYDGENDYRFVLGSKEKDKKNPLVVICLNPASMTGIKSGKTDKTVEKVDEVKNKLNKDKLNKDKLNKDSWIIFNLYPKVSNNQQELKEHLKEHYDDAIFDENKEKIKNWLKNNAINEVWAAWGELKSFKLRQCEYEVLDLLSELNVKVFTFKELLTNYDFPRHPSRMSYEIVSEGNKFYSDKW